MRPHEQQSGMNFVEFIGFVVSIIFFLYFALRKVLEDVKKKRNPEAYAKELKERDAAVKRLYRDDDEEDEVQKPLRKVMPPPAPKLHKSERIVSSSYEVIRKHHVSRGALLIQKQKSKKDLFVIHEIMKAPIALRSQEETLW